MRELSNAQSITGGRIVSEYFRSVPVDELYQLAVR
jgi:hypothetical protein